MLASPGHINIPAGETGLGGKTVDADEVVFIRKTVVMPVFLGAVEQHFVVLRGQKKNVSCQWIRIPITAAENVSGRIPPQKKSDIGSSPSLCGTFLSRNVTDTRPCDRAGNRKNSSSLFYIGTYKSFRLLRKTRNERNSTTGWSAFRHFGRKQQP